MATLWSTEQVGGVVVATYDNAPMNYFCAQGAQELAGLIEQWRDPSVRAVVLGGGGDRGAFLTHYSVEELLAAARDRDALRVAGTSLTRGYHALLLMLRDLPKPIVVAMNGNTMGGGSSSASPATSASGSTVTTATASPRSAWGSSPAAAVRSACPG